HDHSASLYGLCLAQLSEPGRSRGPPDASLADGGWTVAHAEHLGTTLCTTAGAAAGADRVSRPPFGHAAAALGRAQTRRGLRQYALACQRGCLAQETSAGRGSTPFLDRYRSGLEQVGISWLVVRLEAASGGRGRQRLDSFGCGVHHRQ